MLAERGVDGHFSSVWLAVFLDEIRALAARQLARFCEVNEARGATRGLAAGELPLSPTREPAASAHCTGPGRAAEEGRPGSAWARGDSGARHGAGQHAHASGGDTVMWRASADRSEKLRPARRGWQGRAGPGGSAHLCAERAAGAAAARGDPPRGCSECAVRCGVAGARAALQGAALVGSCYRPGGEATLLWVLALSRTARCFAVALKQQCAKGHVYRLAVLASSN